MAAQHIVRQGMRWRVGNGNKIQIWSNKWLPTPTTFKVISPQNTLGDQAMVSDLIDRSLGVWKAELVHRIFLPNEADTILSLPLSFSLPEDSLIWNSTANGMLSVRSAYKLAMDQL